MCASAQCPSCTSHIFAFHTIVGVVSKELSHSKYFQSDVDRQVSMFGKGSAFMATCVDENNRVLINVVFQKPLLRKNFEICLIEAGKSTSD